MGTTPAKRARIANKAILQPGGEAKVRTGVDIDIDQVSPIIVGGAVLMVLVGLIKSATSRPA
jgi:hypothetical protein